ncbi:MAG: Tex-like N-terminal domain-containing protein [Bacteroidia bacterium]
MLVEFTRASGISKNQLQNTLQLFESGATVPFIARYRKEKTGGLTDEQLFDLKKRIREAEKFIERKKYILQKLSEKGVDSGLLNEVENASTTEVLEDLYLPYKEKKKSRAQKARDAGLQPLADMLLKNEKQALGSWNNFKSEHFPDEESVLQGARDILAETFSENAEVRHQLRNLFLQDSVLTSKVVKTKTDEAVKYKDYFDYKEK